MFFANAYMPFTAETCFLGRDIKNRPKFDISFVHMRYNKTAIDEVMQPGWGEEIFKMSGEEYLKS